MAMVALLGPAILPPAPDNDTSLTKNASIGWGTPVLTVRTWNVCRIPFYQEEEEEEEEGGGGGGRGRRRGGGGGGGKVSKCVKWGWIRMQTGGGG